MRFRSATEDHPSRDAIDCNDCGRETDPDDTAPSCGAHVLCVSCYITGDFRCRECIAIQKEDGGMTPLDLTNAGGTFTRERAMSIRECANCHQGIHVGHERINHRLLATSSVTDYYHTECVVIP